MIALGKAISLSLPLPCCCFHLLLIARNGVVKRKKSVQPLGYNDTFSCSPINSLVIPTPIQIIIWMNIKYSCLATGIQYCEQFTV